MNDGDPAFYWQELDRTNVNDAQRSLDGDHLLGIVDEEEGGIIAYALGEEHANMIVAALSVTVRP